MWRVVGGAVRRQRGQRWGSRVLSTASPLDASPRPPSSPPVVSAPPSSRVIETERKVKIPALIKEYYDEMNEPESREPLPSGVVAALLAPPLSAPLSDLHSGHVGRYIPIQAKDIETFFPEGIAGDIAEEWKTTNRPHLMVRQPAITIVNTLRRIQEMSGNDVEHSMGTPQPVAITPKGFLIDGARGTGKTATLQHVVAWARQNNWLTIYIPRATAWTLDPAAVVVATSGLLVQTDLAVEFLQNVLRSNADRLQRIQVRSGYGQFDVSGFPAAELKERFAKEYETERQKLADEGFGEETLKLLPQTQVYNMKDELPAPSSVADIVNFGITNPTYACQAVHELMAQLKQCTEYPILVAIDEYEAFFQKSKYLHESFVNKQWRGNVPPRFLSLCRALMDFDGDQFVNGLKVVARSAKRPTKDVEDMGVPSGLRVHCTEYSPSEMRAAMLFYRHIDVTFNHPTESFTKRVFMFTQGNPLAVSNFVWKAM